MYSFVKIIYTENMDKLNRLWGHVLPTGSVSIPAGYTMEWIGGYEAAEASESADDIEITASFTPNGMLSIPLVDELRLTSVRVELISVKAAPENPCSNRHVYGVCEKIRCIQEPTGFSTTWRESAGLSLSGTDYKEATCPILAEMGVGLEVAYGNTSLGFLISVVNPSGIICKKSGWDGNRLPRNIAGGAGLSLELYVIPMTVSFEEIAIQEDPCHTGTHSGYFDQASQQHSWYHDIDNGAGIWHNISTGNYWTVDNPLVSIKPPPWTNGTNVWDIPVGWYFRDPPAAISSVRDIQCDIKQYFTIDSNGTVRVEKFEHWASRTTNDWCIVDGKTVEDE